MRRKSCTRLPTLREVRIKYGNQRRTVAAKSWWETQKLYNLFFFVKRFAWWCDEWDMNMVEVVKHARAIRVFVFMCLYWNRITILLTMLLCMVCFTWILFYDFGISRSNTLFGNSLHNLLGRIALSLALPRVCNFCVSNPYIASPKLIANAFTCNRQPFFCCSVLLLFFESPFTTPRCDWHLKSNQIGKFWARFFLLRSKRVQIEKWESHWCNSMKWK